MAFMSEARTVVFYGPDVENRVLMPQPAKKATATAASEKDDSKMATDS